MSLLTLIQNTTDLLGIPRPGVVVASTDQQVRQLFALANEEGRSLAGRFDWEVLNKEYTFTTAATPEQPNALPTDFGHFLSNTQYNRSTMRGVIGPITPQVWQQIQAQPALARVYLAFRLRGGVLIITPTPPAGETIADEYISSNWCTSADGTVPKPAFTADSDIALISEDLMQLGLRWRWRKTKGLPYGEDFDTYERECQMTMARDGGSTSINISGASYYGALPNIPEGNWPGP